MNPLHTLRRNTKGDAMLMAVVVSVVIGLVVLLWAMTNTGKAANIGNEFIDKATGCEGFSGECLAYCTADNPPMIGGGKSLGCKDDKVCCKKNTFDQVVLKYRMDGGFAFLPLDLMRVEAVPDEKKFYFEFWIQNPKQAAYCTIKWNTGTPDSILTTGVSYDPKNLDSENGYTQGVCPEEQGTFFSLPQDQFSKANAVTPPAFSIIVTVYPTDPGGNDNALYLKKYIAGLQQE